MISISERSVARHRSGIFWIPRIRLLAHSKKSASGRVWIPTLAGGSPGTFCCGPSAAGSASGADWSNRVDFDTVTPVRGDTYYLMTGAYAAKTLSTAQSGTGLITIKKATPTDHVTETGWQASYGVGQAAFPYITTSSPYWLIDGQYRTNENGGHGIRVQPPTADRPVTMNAGSNFITWRLVDVSNAASPPENGPDIVYAALSGAIHDIRFSYCLLKNSGRTFWYSDGAYALIFENTVFDTCYPHPPSYHGEFFQLRSASDVTIRWCRFTNHGWLPNMGLTGVIASMSGGIATAYIYGNIFDRLSHSIYQDNSGTTSNMRIYNNSFYGECWIQFPLGYSNIDFRNNVLYDCPWSPIHRNTTGYNYHSLSVFPYGSPLTGTGEPPVYDGGDGYYSTITANPFVSVAAEDFRLAAALSGYPGISIANVGSHRFDLDYNGNVRGADGVWDRGAIEFGVGGPSPPAAPTNLRIVA